MTDHKVPIEPPEREPGAMTPDEARHMRAEFASNPLINLAEEELRKLGATDAGGAVETLRTWAFAAELTEREHRAVVARFVPVEPGELRHFVELPDAHTACGLVRGDVRWTDQDDFYDCPACADVLARATDPLPMAAPLPAVDTWVTPADDAPEERNCGRIEAHEPHTWPDGVGIAFSCPGGWTAEEFAETFPDLAPQTGPEAARSVQRTVGLEVLTAELRAEEDARRAALPDAGRTAESSPLPPGAVVAIVERADGRLVAITDTDLTWRWTRDSAPILLADMLRAMPSWSLTAPLTPPVELLMPSPAVLAALAGVPLAGLWTAPLEVRADQVDVGWLLRDFAKPGAEELVEAVVECEDESCPWLDCHVIDAKGVEPVHFEGFHRLTARIPAAGER